MEHTALQLGPPWRPQTPPIFTMGKKHRYCPLVLVLGKADVFYPWRRSLTTTPEKPGSINKKNAIRACSSGIEPKII